MVWPCLMFVKCYPQMALNEKSEKRSKLLIFICQNIGLLSGWGIMFLLSYYEEELLHLKIFHRWRGVVTPSTPSFIDEILLLMERMKDHVWGNIDWKAALLTYFLSIFWTVSKLYCFIQFPCDMEYRDCRLKRSIFWMYSSEHVCDIFVFTHS